MPVHDWTRVEAGIFHDFHTVWTGTIRSALNEGLLPPGYYALAEQHAGRGIAEVLTLHENPSSSTSEWVPPDSGGVALAEAPPRVSLKQTLKATPLARRRSVAIRHVSGHRLIALIEIISPASKDLGLHVGDLVSKVISAFERGIHVLIIDLFPQGGPDPSGIHGSILEVLEPHAPSYALPTNTSLTLASYVAGASVDAYLEHPAVGVVLPEMPLFLRPDHYVHLPLEPTYACAARHARILRAMLEGRPPAGM